MKRSSNIKIALLLLLLIWIGTLFYIWFPGIASDNLHLHTDTLSNDMANALDEQDKVMRESVAAETAQAVHVVISSDSHTLGGMVALVHSIVSNTRSPVFFHLITDTHTSDHLRTWLKGTKLREVNFEIKEFPLVWVEGKIKVRGGRAELANPLNYARFFLPDLFPGINGRIVYIDDDCIVQGDISELNDMQLKPGTLAAFSEDCKGMNKHISFMQNVYADFFDLKNKHYQDLKINPKACAFNTGLFVTNLTEWRQHGITDQLLYWLELNTKEELYGNEKGGGGSQPPMMVVFYNKYTPIDQLWHVRFLGWTSKTSYSRELIQKAKLLHWNGRLKPWGRISSLQDIWDHYFLPDPTHKFQPVRMAGH